MTVDKAVCVCASLAHNDSVGQLTFDGFGIMILVRIVQIPGGFP